ncbi:hypothetical protein FQN49_005292 [Arthroderma sp. PD_2]|nr:hypothetical protein FQN49_005292 [Arthroderma sp. PD_2]
MSYRGELIKPGHDGIGRLLLVPPGSVTPLYIMDTFERYFITCHPEIHLVEKVAHLAWEMAKLAAEDEDDLVGLANAVYEYGDIFESMAKIIECRYCFSENGYYNIPQPKGKICWAEVAHAILSCPSRTLLSCLSRSPRAYYIERAPMDEEKARDIIRWLERICRVLGWRFADISWQIVVYHTYHELPGGPRVSIRTGHWAQLAANIIDMSSRIQSLAAVRLPRHPNIIFSAPVMVRILRYVEHQWFISLKPSGEFDLSDTALEVNLSIACHGSYNGNLCGGYRGISLYALPVPESHMSSNPFVPHINRERVFNGMLDPINPQDPVRTPGSHDIIEDRLSLRDELFSCRGPKADIDLSFCDEDDTFKYYVDILALNRGCDNFRSHLYALFKDEDGDNNGVLGVN